MAHLKHAHRRAIQGIAGASTVDPAQATGTSLALDTSTNTHSQSAIPLVSTVPTVTLSTPTPTLSSSDDTQSTSNPSQEPAQKAPISMTVVVGSCVGAAVGALSLILVGILIYKRSAPKPKNRSPISPHAAYRNARGEADRSRSGTEMWDKLDDGKDKWDGQTREVSRPESVGPMEKLTMFKKSPSIRTAATEKSYEAPIFDLEPHPFAQYHPNLAKEMATEADPHLRPFLARVDTGPALSWESGQASYLSLTRLSGNMSTETDMAIQPHITMSDATHRWESAEVLHYDGEMADKNPFVPTTERRKSANNPFFGAQSGAQLPRSRRSSRSSLGKGKERDTSDGMDPFADENVPSVPKIKQVNVGTTETAGMNERAIKSLIAALDFHAGEEGLRVTSMQPSVYSSTSIYTEEEDVTDAFPLPPGSDK